jgi:DNA-binding IclR family transcriptional regulator
MELPVNLSERDAGGAQSVSRAIKLLQIISMHNRKGMRLTDLAEKTQLQKPTVHRLLKQLIAGGLVMQGPKRIYRLGQFSYELGLAASLHFRLRETCEPHLHRLAMETGDTSCLLVRSGTDAICLDQKLGSFPVKVFTLEIGHRQPLGVGSAGLALLSALPEEEIESILRANEAKLETRWRLPVGKLREFIAQTQAQGYASISNYSIPGVTGVGRVIVDRAGKPVGAISVVAISSRMDEARQLSVNGMIAKEIARLADVMP